MNKYERDIKNEYSKVLKQKDFIRFNIETRGAIFYL